LPVVGVLRVAFGACPLVYSGGVRGGFTRFRVRLELRLLREEIPKRTLHLPFLLPLFMPIVSFNVWIDKGSDVPPWKPRARTEALIISDRQIGTLRVEMVPIPGEADGIWKSAQDIWN
jgi:hypothetical protein